MGSQYSATESVSQCDQIVILIRFVTGDCHGASIDERITLYCQRSAKFLSGFGETVVLHQLITLADVRHGRGE